MIKHLHHSYASVNEYQSNCEHVSTWILAFSSSTASQSLWHGYRLQSIDLLVHFLSSINAYTVVRYYMVIQYTGTLRPVFLSLTWVHVGIRRRKALPKTTKRKWLTRSPLSTTILSPCWIPHWLCCLWNWSKKFSCIHLTLAVLAQICEMISAKPAQLLLTPLSQGQHSHAQTRDEIHFPLPRQSSTELIVLTQPGQ